MNELQKALIGDSAAVPPDRILERLPAKLEHRSFPNVPHTIYEELWHIAFWQQVTLDWISGIETQFPEHPSAGFPAHSGERWEDLCARFFAGLQQASAAAGDALRLEVPVRCPSRPGMPLRVMTVREQLESLAAHNAYHFGRIVLLRQLGGAWPPASGGFTW